MLKTAMKQHGMSAWAYHRILKLARTIAGLGGSVQTEKAGLIESQLTRCMGHASIKTAERYLGVDQDLTGAAPDRLDLRLE